MALWLLERPVIKFEKQKAKYTIMKRKLTQYYSTILTISTTWTISSHLNSMNIRMIMTYDVGNPGIGLGQAQKCGGVKQVNLLIIAIHYTVKPAHVVTSIKQSPVLKGHIFIVPTVTSKYRFDCIHQRQTRWTVS